MTWLKRDDFHVICSKSLFDVWECLGKSMMMLQWQLISCRTRMLHISRCALQSTISWTWWLSFGAPIRQGTDSETFPQKAWCHCNPTVVIITSILEYGVYSLNIKRVFRFVFFLFFGDLLVGSVGWLCRTGKFEKSDGVITLWPKKIVFIFRSEESTTEKSGNKTCFSLQVIQSTVVFFLNHSSWK